MRPHFFISFIIVLTLSSFGGCTKAVRYSSDEIKDYPPTIQDYIKNGEVALGMTPLQVRFSWGAPSKIDVLSPSLDGKPKEQWIYSRVGTTDNRLLFVDGKLFDIYPEPKYRYVPGAESEAVKTSPQEKTE